MKFRGNIYFIVFLVPLVALAQATYKSVMWNDNAPPTGFQVPYFNSATGVSDWKTLSWTNLNDRPVIPNAAQVFKPADTTALNNLTRNVGDIAFQQNNFQVFVADSSLAWNEIKRGRVYGVMNAASLSNLTGMREGDAAIQSDIDTWFIYNGLSWVDVARGKAFRHTSPSARSSEIAMRDGDISYSTYENSWFVYSETYGWLPIKLDATSVVYNDSATSITATNVQQAIDVLVTRTDAYDFDTSSFSNSSTNGIYVHNDGDNNLFEIDHRAQNNPVTDSGGYYAGANVEAVLQEVGDDISDFRTALGISDGNSDFGSLSGGVLTDNSSATNLFNEIDIELSKVGQKALLSGVGEQGGYNFAGTSSYLVYPNSDFLTTTNSFTFSVDLRWGNPAADEGVVGNYNGSVGWGLIWNQSNQELRALVQDEVVAIPGALLSTGERYNVTAVFGSSTSFSVLLNGRVIATDNSVAAFDDNAARSVTIGTVGAANLATYPFSGHVYNFRYWNLALDTTLAMAVAGGYNYPFNQLIHLADTSTESWGWLDVSGNTRSFYHVGDPGRIDGPIHKSFVSNSDHAQWRRLDGGYKFDGVDDRVVTPDILINAGLSVVVDVESSGLPGSTSWIISSDGGLVATRVFEVYQLTSGVIQFTFGGDNAVAYQTGKLTLTGQSNLAFSFNETTKALSLYVNGNKIPVVQISDGFTAFAETARPIAVGKPGRTSGSFHGNIRGFRVFNAVLTETELQQYAVGVDVVNSNPVAHYTPESATTAIWEDVSGNERHAVNASALLIKPTLQETYFLEQDAVAEDVVSGPSYRFDADNDYVSIPNIPISGDFTIVLSIDQNPIVSGTDWILRKVGGNNTFTIGVESTRYFILFIDNSGSTATYYFPVNPVTGPQVLAWSLDRDGVAGMYRNGKLISSVNISGSSGVNLLLNTDPLFFGYSVNSIDGESSNLEIYNRALSGSEVAQVSKGQNLGFADYGATGAASYASDFSVNANGWSSSGFGATSPGNIDSIGGQDDVLRILVNSESSFHFSSIENIFSRNKRYYFKCKIYIPSTNSHCDSVAIRQGTESQYSIYEPIAANISKNTWVDIESYFIATGAGVADRLYIYMSDGGAFGFQDASADDVIYVKDIVVTPIGLVLDLNDRGVTSGTWYDDSGNNYDGVVTGATAINMNHHWQGIEAQADGDVVIESDLVVTDTTTLSTVSQDNALTKVLVLDGTDVVKWRDVSTINAGADGDDLGNHTATTALNMATNNITNIGDIHVGGDFYDNAAGVGTNGQFLGKSGGEVRWLTLSGADNLGNHTATTTLWLQNNAITNALSLDVDKILAANLLGGERQYLGANSSGDIQWKPLSTLWDSDGGSSSGWFSTDQYLLSLAGGSVNSLWIADTSKFLQQFAGVETSSFLQEDGLLRWTITDLDSHQMSLSPGLWSVSYSGVNPGSVSLTRDEMDLTGVNLDLNGGNINSVVNLDIDGNIIDINGSTGATLDVLTKSAGGVVWDKPEKVWSPNGSNTAGWTNDSSWSVSYGATPRLTVSSASITIDTTNVDFTGAGLDNVNYIEIDGEILDFNDQSGVAGQVLSKRSGTGVDWIDLPASGEANTASNLGAGSGLYAAKSGVNLQFKSLVAGSNVTLTSDSSTVTINSTGGGGSGEYWRIGDNANFTNSMARVTTGGLIGGPDGSGNVDIYVQHGGMAKDFIQIPLRSVTVYHNADDALPPGIPDPGYGGSSPVNTLAHPLEVRHGDIIVGDEVGHGYGLVLPEQEPNGEPTGNYYRVIIRRTNAGNPSSAVLMFEPYTATQLPYP